MKQSLTKKENKVFQWIKSSQQESGGYPTYRDIQKALKFHSINSITQYVKQLAKKGYLDLVKNKGYRLSADQLTSMVSLPMLGSVQAGGPNFTQEEAETMTLPQQMVQSPQRSYVLKVRGDSMTDAGINDGDMVIVDSSKKAANGDIVVALLDGENTVKRLAEKGGKQYLKAESSEHPDIIPEGLWEIQGVVTGLTRSY